MILILDNYDSFVFNLARYVRELGAEVQVIRNDALTTDDIASMAPAGILLSPGPCTPSEAGISMDVVRRFSGTIPLFGVCLGHQTIGATFGGTVMRASAPLHGQASQISHTGHAMFQNVPKAFAAGRYHSLIVEDITTEGPLIVTARTEDGAIMGLAHKEHITWGVQFHPESVLTEHGHTLLANFLHAAHINTTACSGPAIPNTSECLEQSA